MICCISPSIKIPNSSVLTITHSFLRRGDIGEFGSQSHMFHILFLEVVGSHINSSAQVLIPRCQKRKVVVCVLREPCILPPLPTLPCLFLFQPHLSISPLNVAITSMLYEQCLENRVKQGGTMWWKEYTTWIRRAIGRQCHLFVGWIEQDLSLLGTCSLSCKMDMMVCSRELVRIKWV